MHPVFERNEFVIKRRITTFKTSADCDIHDPATKKVILYCREENINVFSKLLRVMRYNFLTPFEVKIITPSHEETLTIQRVSSFFFPAVEVLDEKRTLLGKFKRKAFSFGKKVITDSSERILCILKERSINSAFRFISSDAREFARVTQNSNLLDKNPFTPEDIRLLQINPEVPVNHPLRALILAATLCIDSVVEL